MLKDFQAKYHLVSPCCYKMQEEREKLKKELLKKKEAAFGNLGGAQPIQIAKVAKIRKLGVGNACSVKKAKCVAGYLLLYRLGVRLVDPLSYLGRCQE